MSITTIDQVVNIVIIDRSGKNHEVEVPTDIGLNLMEVCKASELPVKGTCGGMALCASCHCYVENGTVGNRSEDEEDMLDQAFYVEENSRLSCQMKISDDMQGLKIRLAPDDED